MKAPKILKSLNEGEEYYKDKIKLLAKIIDYPFGGYIIRKEIVQWASENGLDVQCTLDSGTSWWTCKEFI